MKTKKVACLFVCAIVCTLALCASTSAQTELASVTGLVLDPNAAAIVQATVTAKNLDTGIETVVQTNSEGLYHFQNLEPGNYEFSVSKRGFKVIVKPGVTLHVVDTVSMNFTMQVGDVRETVTVQGGAPLINTENAAVSTVIDRKFVENLPLNGRSFNTLLQLTPGVVIAPTNGLSPGQFSIAGQRTDANNFTVDGVSANFGVSPISTSALGNSGAGGTQAFSALGGTSSLVSVEALQEFRVETSSFAPEFGRSPGGQVILSTRSGTNSFHGGLYEYFRNDVMDANDWFANEVGKPRSPERHNDLGGFFGGPIWKDKTFFFLSYEGARLRLPTGGTIQVPSEWARTVKAPPAIVPFLDAYPRPDDKTVTSGTYTARFTDVHSNQATLNAGSVRVDHAFNDRFLIFGRYNEAPSQFVTRNGSELDTTVVNTRTLTVGANMFLSSRLSNSVRANFSQQNSNLTRALDSFGGAVRPDPSLFVGSLSSTASDVSFLSFDTAIYEFGRQAANRTRQLNFVDDLSMVTGTHRLKFGADYRAIFLSSVPAQNTLTYISFSLQSFVDSGGQVFQLTAARRLQSQILAQASSLYAQDTFQPLPRLTLTYGVRWELNPAPSGRGTTKLAAWTNVNSPAAISLAPFGTPPWSTTYGNFAPRFGVAYSLTQKGDWVVRGGGGLFYDLGVGSAASLAGNFPNAFGKSSLFVSLPVTDITPFLPAVSTIPPFPPAAGFDPNLKLPRSYQWNVAMEKSFADRQALSITYVAQAGQNLLRQKRLVQPNTSFGNVFDLTVSDAKSNYNALQLQYRRPLSSRLQALLNYTWSHSLDNASDDALASLTNTVISGTSDYASSSFDVRQSFSGALAYDLPSAAKTGPVNLLTKGWSVDTAIVVRTGLPFNATSVVFNGVGVSNLRPDRILGQPLFLYGAQCAQAFGPSSQGGSGVLQAGQSCPGGMGVNPNAFVAPSTLRQGTEGRNDIPGFGLTQVDISLGRTFSFTERINLQFRTDAFNVFNHPNFANPAALFSFGTQSLPSFLSGSLLNTPLGTAGLNPLFQEGGPRSLQLSLRLSF